MQSAASFSALQLRLTIKSTECLVTTPSLGGQIYGFCRPSEADDLSSRVSDCVDEVSAWMKSNRLQLNPSKTEVLWCSSARRLHQIPTSPVRIGNTSVLPVSSVRDLGVYLDADVAMKSEDTRHCCRAIVFRGNATDPERAAFFTATRPTDSDPCARDQQGRLLLLRFGRYFRSPTQQTTVRPERRGATDFLDKEVRPHNSTARVNPIGFESRSGSSSGCVCCHTAVFTEQLHHTSPTVCVDMILRVVVFVRLSQTHWLSR